MQIQRFNVNNKIYFLNKEYDGQMSVKYTNDVLKDIKEKTVFFENVDEQNPNKSLLITLALKHTTLEYYDEVDKLLLNKNFNKVATNIEKYTKLYVMQLNIKTGFCGPNLKEASEINKNFNIDKAYGFIAVKKEDFKSKQEAYKYMLTLAKEYKKASKALIYKITIYNETEEHITFIDDTTHKVFKTDEDLIEYVLKQTKC